MPSSSLVVVEVEVEVWVEFETAVEIEVGVILLFWLGGWVGGVGGRLQKFRIKPYHLPISS